MTESIHWNAAAMLAFLLLMYRTMCIEQCNAERPIDKMLRNERTTAVRRVFLGLLLMSLWLLASCSPTVENATPTSPAPEPLLRDAVNNIRTADSFAMDVEQGGTPFAFIFQLGANDAPFRTVMQRAQAHFVAPDQLHANGRITVEESASISIQLFVDGFTQWIKPPLLGWRQYEYAPGFNPRLLMGEDSGFNRALSRLNSLEYIGQETRLGETVYHLRGSANGEVVNDLLFGLLIINNPVAIVDVFIEAETRLPTELLLTLPDTATDTTDDTFWRLDLFDINQPQNFEQPAPELVATTQAAVETTPEVTSEVISEATAEATSESTAETDSDQ